MGTTSQTNFYDSFFEMSNVVTKRFEQTESYKVYVFSRVQLVSIPQIITAALVRGDTHGVCPWGVVVRDVYDYRPDILKRDWQFSLDPYNVNIKDVFINPQQWNRVFWVLPGLDTLISGVL